MGTEKGIKSIQVKVYSMMGIASGTFLYDAEIVPYVNGVSGKRDPMIRQVINKGHFLHLSTVLDGPNEYQYGVKTKAGGQKRIKPCDVMGLLYGEDEAFDY